MLIMCEAVFNLYLKKNQTEIRTKLSRWTFYNFLPFRCVDRLYMSESVTYMLWVYGHYEHFALSARGSTRIACFSSISRSIVNGFSFR